MRLVEVLRTSPELADRLDEFSGAIELQDARHRTCRRRVAFSDEDAAIRGDQDVVRLPEVSGITGPALRAHREKQLALGAELEDLVAV